MPSVYCLSPVHYFINIARNKSKFVCLKLRLTHVFNFKWRRWQPCRWLSGTNNCVKATCLVPKFACCVAGPSEFFIQRFSIERSRTASPVAVLQRARVSIARQRWHVASKTIRNLRNLGRPTASRTVRNRSRKAHCVHKDLAESYYSYNGTERCIKMITRSISACCLLAFWWFFCLNGNDK